VLLEKLKSNPPFKPNNVLNKQQVSEPNDIKDQTWRLLSPGETDFGQVYAGEGIKEVMNRKLPCTV
jgi:hypothetical protein